MTSTFTLKMEMALMARPDTVTFICILDLVVHSADASGNVDK